MTKIAFVAISLGLWAAAYAYMLRSTRPSSVEPEAATQELPGSEPPAVVSLLANDWRITEDAAESTLLDLAARRRLEFRQPANDPKQTTVHLAATTGDQPLTPYEQQVLDLVTSVAYEGGAPVSALTFRDRAAATAWRRSFGDAVVAEARARGLSRRRFSQRLLVVLIAGSVLPAGAVYAALWGTGYGRWGALLTLGVLYLVAARPLGERDTAAGRVVARRWLAVREFLRGDEAFAELPPAAVTVWDRYLAYGAALGATRVSSTVLDLGMGDRTRVWSAYTGHWRQVRITYPRLGLHYCKTPQEVTRGALGLLIPVAVMAGVSGLVLSRADYVNVPALVGAAVVAGLLVVRSLYLVVRAQREKEASREITGQVLWIEAWQVREEDQKVPHHHLAVDDGLTGETRAWALPNTMVDQVRVGDVVHLEVLPWTRRVMSIAPAV
ncbi:hypothetical protein JCM9957A_44470 [Kineosporia succinea]